VWAVSLATGCAMGTGPGVRGPEVEDIEALEAAIAAQESISSGQGECLDRCRASVLICDCAERICELASDLAELDAMERCRRARESCREARERVSETCSCEWDRPPT